MIASHPPSAGLIKRPHHVSSQDALKIFNRVGCTLQIIPFIALILSHIIVDTTVPALLSGLNEVTALLLVRYVTVMVMVPRFGPLGVIIIIAGAALGQVCALILALFLRSLIG
jgi:predicted lysophospholipase L1 biosynthesis ABC-type transport system permease subunit